MPGGCLGWEETGSPREVRGRPKRTEGGPQGSLGGELRLDRGGDSPAPLGEGPFVMGLGAASPQGPVASLPNACVWVSVCGCV